MAKIPKTLHYCFGMAPDFGGKKWGLSHYACVRSAIDKIKPDNVYLYYQYEPQGGWWEETKKLVDLVQIEAPTQIFGNPVTHPAHRADIVRLEKLLELGGIYLDSDVLVHKSFDDLLGHSAVLGAEGRGAAFGTANAVILSEPNSDFLRRWYEEYRTFRGQPGRFWNEHSVQLPLYLSRRFPSEIEILNYRAFFWPLWTKDHVEWIFNSTRPCVYDDTYATHLWDGKSYRYTKNLTPGDVRRVDTNFHRWCRPYLSHLSDDFGLDGAPIAWESRAPSQMELARDRVEMGLRRLRSLVKPRRFEEPSLFR